MRIELLFPAALALTACGDRVELLPDGVTDVGGSSDGSSGDGPGACLDPGPPIALAGAACAGGVAAHLGRYALCSCATLAFADGVQTDSFDSTGGSGDQHGSAALGTDGDFSSQAATMIGGALWVGGSGGATMNAHLDTRQSLRVAGPLSSLSSDVQSFGDALVDGDLTGHIKVMGTLYVPQSAVVDSAVMASSTVIGPVTIAPPCAACDAANRPDLAATIAAATAQNDDARYGLTPGDLQGGSVPPAIDLHCGRYLFSTIATATALALRVHGRALLVVAGDATLGGALDVTFDDGAELDLLIGGSLTMMNGGTLGDSASPARFRIWVAGPSVTWVKRPQVGAVVLAPLAALAVPDGLDLSGSLAVASLTEGGSFALHFDRALLAAGAPCGLAPEPAVP